MAYPWLDDEVPRRPAHSAKGYQHQQNTRPAAFHQRRFPYTVAFDRLSELGKLLRLSLRLSFGEAVQPLAFVDAKIAAVALHQAAIEDAARQGSPVSILQSFQMTQRELRAVCHGRQRHSQPLSLFS